MSLIVAVGVILLLFSQAQAQAQNATYGKKGEFIYANFQRSSNGNEISFKDKTTLMANVSKGSLEDCEMECVEHPKCLSVVSIDLKTNPEVFQCMLYNWSSTEFENRLSAKTNALSFQAQTICKVANPCQNGGECIANTGPYKYICNCTNGYAGRHCEKKCILFDFESGRLDGWILTGTAFNNQPTYGDNPNIRGGGTSNLKGNWFIGTFENRPKPSQPAGQTQGDSYAGVILSPPFIIKGKTIKFLVGAGTDSNANVQLLVNGVVTYTFAPASGTEAMSEKTFDVTNYREQAAQIRVVDESTGLWGHINVDHFEDTICNE